MAVRPVFTKAKRSVRRARVRDRHLATRSEGVLRQPGLRSDRSAAAALEFAIATVPFLALLLFFFEIGLDYYYQTALDYGIAKSARQVQIGNAQSISTPQDFKAKLLCPALLGLLDCDTINVASVTIAGAPDYYHATLPSPTQNGTMSLSGYSAGFTTGSQNSPMYLQAMMQSPSLIAGLIPGFATPTGSGRVRLTVSSTAFINENYANATSPSS